MFNDIMRDLKSRNMTVWPLLPGGRYMKVVDMYLSKVDTFDASSNNLRNAKSNTVLYWTQHGLKMVPNVLKLKVYLELKMRKLFYEL